MNKLGGRRAGGGASLSSLNNVLMQMRKNCNHPDLITAPFEGGSLCVLQTYKGRLHDLLGAGLRAWSSPWTDLWSPQLHDFAIR